MKWETYKLLKKQEREYWKHRFDNDYSGIYNLGFVMILVGYLTAVTGLYIKAFPGTDLETIISFFNIGNTLLRGGVAYIGAMSFFIIVWSLISKNNEEKWLRSLGIDKKIRRNK